VCRGSQLSRTPSFCYSHNSDTLRAGRPGVRMSVGTTFCGPIHTGPRPTQPPLQWVSVFFTELKRSERGADDPPPSNTKVEYG
jgi:hypothetical protein